jgi:hypothetical protein
MPANTPNNDKFQVRILFVDEQRRTIEVIRPMEKVMIIMIEVVRHAASLFIIHSTS